MSHAVQIADHAGIRELRLNRPKVHNAFDDRLIAELTAALQAAGSDPSVRVVVLTGVGASFSAGADLNWMRDMAKASEEANREDSLRLAALMRTLQFLPKPTIARVNGPAYGGGVGLIACCDIAIGVTTAKFGLTEVKLGLVPAVISPYVIAAIGLRHARRLFLTGEIFGTTMATQIGLLHQAVDAEHLDDSVYELLKQLGKAGPAAQHEAKKLAFGMHGFTESQAERVDRENAALIARLRISQEGQEGLGAFLDKRSPNWSANS